MTDAHGVMVDAAPQPTPYGLAGIEGDAIVIRLTADACAFAFANDPQAREPRPPVINKQQFLRDTLNELTAEREDGSTPLTDMLDRAMVKAMENGSDALDHDAAGVTPDEIGKRSTSAATASGHEIPDAGESRKQAMPGPEGAGSAVANGGDARVASAGSPSSPPGMTTAIPLPTPKSDTGHGIWHDLNSAAEAVAMQSHWDDNYRARLAARLRELATALDAAPGVKEVR